MHSAYTVRCFEEERAGRFSSFDHPLGVVRIERHIALSINCDHLCIPGEREESLWCSSELAHHFF